MTDNEIIKALECCKIGNCDDCPFYGVKEDCEVELPEDALDLINRQKAEIERLKGFNENLQTGNTALSNEILEIKSEAIKEFAERLKSKIWHSPECNYISSITPDYIDNLVKEMTEVSE